VRSLLLPAASLKESSMRVASYLRGVSAAFGSTLGVLVIPTAAQDQPLVPCGENALQAAIRRADVDGGGTLDLTPGCTYAVTTPDNDDALPRIVAPITINGGGDIVTRSSATPFRIFEIGPPAGNLTLNCLIISNGHAAGTGDASGGGIRIDHDSRLTLNASTVTGNVADHDGGGIDNHGGTVALNGSTLSDNAAGAGGGLAQEGGSVTLFRTTVTGDNARIGGGLAITNTGTVTLSEAHVTGNAAQARPGGISNDRAHTWLVRSSVTANVPTNCDGSPGSVPGCAG
jgi:hypothetical protein